MKQSKLFIKKAEKGKFWIKVVVFIRGLFSKAKAIAELADNIDSIIEQVEYLIEEIKQIKKEKNEQ